MDTKESGNVNKKLTRMKASGSMNKTVTKKREDTRRNIYNMSISSNFDKISTVKQGVSKDTLAQFKQLIALDYGRLSSILGTTKTTLHKKQGTEKFSLSVSEKFVTLVDLYTYGYEVFGDEEKFNRWIQTENRALGNTIPLDLLDTIFGINEVRNLIGRIEHGLFS
jgi:putative toxin-antitoxin system antitoxin component (TIGR02293 family)